MIRSAAAAILTLVAAAASVSLAPATATAQHPADTAPNRGAVHRHHRTVTCLSNGHVIARNHRQGRYQVRNAFWLGQRPQCLVNRDGRTNFRVVQRAGYSRQGHVVAYPDILRGCIWHVCSPHALLPRPARSIGSPVATWHTAERAPGTWNASFDIWFGKKRMVTGQANGAELMIWLNEHGGCCALQHGAKTVVIDGRKWKFSHWRTSNLGATWNYVQFRREKRTWKVDDLRLKPFIRFIERAGLVHRNWWLENIEAGFEIWTGGQGLATTRYQVQHVAPARARA
jgi:Glycosyl hydrolase family 12